MGGEDAESESGEEGPTTCFAKPNPDFESQASVYPTTTATSERSTFTAVNACSRLYMAQPPALTALYSSPSDVHTFARSLPSLPQDLEKQTVQAKTAYLSALRSSITQMQSGVNAFLTRKMEEDKAAEAAAGVKKKAADEKAEEMYGEEEGEEDG